MARERAARRRPRTRALGDHARWMAFAAPYGALVLTLSARGYERKGHIGTACALCVSALVLPYWRAWCGRPVFAFYGLALGRYRRKRGDGTIISPLDFSCIKLRFLPSLSFFSYLKYFTHSTPLNKSSTESSPSSIIIHSISCFGYVCD